MDINIPLENVLEFADDYDVEEILQFLIEHKYISSFNIIKSENTFMNEHWRKTCEKLYANRLRLTVEEENIIEEISKKY